MAALGLKPEVHLGKSLQQMQGTLRGLGKKFGVNVCGEGGEYETLTLDCPLFTVRPSVPQPNPLPLTLDCRLCSARPSVS